MVKNQAIPGKSPNRAAVTSSQTRVMLPWTATLETNPIPCFCLLRQLAPRSRCLSRHQALPLKAEDTVEQARAAFSFPNCKHHYFTTLQHILWPGNSLMMIVWVQDMPDHNINPRNNFGRGILGLLSFSVEFMGREAALLWGYDGLSWIMKKGCVR